MYPSPLSLGRNAVDNGIFHQGLQGEGRHQHLHGIRLTVSVIADSLSEPHLL